MRILVNTTQLEKEKKLIVFDDMIAEIMSYKETRAIVKELYIRSRKLNHLLVFIAQYYFSVPKDVRINSTHHSEDTDYSNFMNIYREYTKESCFFDN